MNARRIANVRNVYEDGTVEWMMHRVVMVGRRRDTFGYAVLLTEYEYEYRRRACAFRLLAARAHLRRCVALTLAAATSGT